MTDPKQISRKETNKDLLQRLSEALEKSRKNEKESEGNLQFRLSMMQYRGRQRMRAFYDGQIAAYNARVREQYS